MLLLPLLLLIPLALAHTASLYFPSIPEDLYAFPKHRVSFVNGLYLTNETAHRWLTDGLLGGEDEFLGRDWKSKSITGQEDASSTSALQELNPMRLGPNTTYLCLIPSPPLATSFSSQGDKAPTSRSPAKSWELLQPMSQGCLYHVLGWFTYAYCHGKYVKQFREAPHAHPHPPGGRIPEEDPEWESYFLGVAPHQDSTELVTAEDVAAANKLELARGAGQRYLVQRWEDGTVCDKTGATRRVEVQFHCSMTTPDKILLIKETSTCNYVLVIHTPRLCGEPGFKSERDTQEESVIRCREILNEQDQAKHTRLAASERPDTEIQTSSSADPAPAPHSSNPGLNEGRHPVRFPLVQPQKLLPKLPIVDPDPEAASSSSSASAAAAAATGDATTTTTTGNKQSGKKDHAQLLRRALQALLRQTQEDGAPVADGDDRNDNDNAGDGASALFGSEDVIAVDGEDGQKVFLFVDNLDELDGLDLAAAGDDIGTDADGVRLEDDAAGRLTAMRKKLLESLTSTLSNAARRSTQNTPSEDAEKKKGDQDDDEGALGTHDEL